MLGYSFEEGGRSKRSRDAPKTKITREPTMADVAIAPFGKQAGMLRKSSVPQMLKRTGEFRHVTEGGITAPSFGVKPDDIQLASINSLKLRRYPSTRFETAPPKLEVSFRVMQVLRSETGAKETTPVAR